MEGVEQSTMIYGVKIRIHTQEGFIGFGEIYYAEINSIQF